jgi:hypothetical protein
MEIPIINKVSGTEPSDLLDAYETVGKAVDRAIKALTAVWPHARDYQGGDIRRALHEHAERCKSLRQVSAELKTIAEGVLIQLPM